MGDPPFDYGAPRHDWNIEDIEWDQNEVRAELRASRSPDASAEASSAAQQVASSSGPTHESGGDVPVVLDTLQSMGSTKRRVPMQCQVDGCSKDLSVEKEYYQRYRICEEHLKLSSLLKDGVQQRFCQQSCRARLDLHNNRRRKRGEAGDGSFRSSARLERRLGDALHARVSPRTRARRVVSRSRRSPMPSTDDEMTEDNNSEVEQAAAPRAGSSAEADEGTPARERRYATRQATAAAQRRHSYNPALDFEKLYPPSIAETLAALQRGSGPQEISQAHTRMSLQEGSSWDVRASLTAGGRQRLVAEQMLRHLSDPVQSMRDTLRQHSENALLVNSLSSPTYMPSSMERPTEGSAPHGSLEFRDTLERNPDMYQPQGAGAQMPYGGPFSEALGAAGLSHYAAQLLYKCASDPVTQDTFGRPNLPPAAIAGVHTAPGAADSAPAGGGGSDQRIISYSSEPTSISSSGLAKFPSEPFVRPRTVYPQYSAFDLPPGEFHDVAWPGPPNAPSADEVKQEQLSFRSGPTKRFFETAEDSSQGARARSRAHQQQQRGEQQHRRSLDAGVAGQTSGSVLPFTLPGLGSHFSMGALSSLAHSSAGGGSGSGGGLSRLPSQDEIQVSMQREPSTERRMGRISLAHSLDIMQQRMTGDRQALQSGERSGSVGDTRRSAAEGPQQPSAHLRTSTSSRLEQLPSGFLERIPEHAATLEAPLTAQDLLPAGRGGSALLSDIYTGFNFQSAQGGAGFAPAGSPGEGRMGEGASHFAAFQGLRDASLQPWHQVASPSQAGLAPLVGTPAGRAAGQPEGTAWAASLFASPSSTAMSSTPSKDGTTPSSWLSPLLQQVVGGSVTAPALTSGDTAGAGPNDTAQMLSTWRTDSGASFSTLPLPYSSAPERDEPPVERTPSPSAMLAAAPAQRAGAAAVADAPELPAAPAGALPAEMPPASAAAAQAAWAEEAGSPRRPAPAGPADARLQGMRVSAKLESAGPQDLTGRSLRPDLEGALGGEGKVARLEAAIRPGCVHLVVDALVLQECPADALDGIRKAATTLAAKDPLWRCGRVLLQTGSAAALLQDGVVRRIWVGKELERRQPEMPCAAPFASLVPGSLALRLHRSFFHCPRAGLSCARPRRLLARCRGRFLADIDLSALQAAHIKEVVVEQGAAGDTPGLAWLEAECDGFMSAPLPVVLSPDHDIVDEIRALEPDVAAGRRSWEETSALLADVGLILEYAALLCDKERAAAPDLRYTLCLQHVARVAQRRLADFCELGWPALTAQALPVAALGCTSLRQLLSEVAAVPEGLGTLLHAAVRSECLSMVSVLLDLGRFGFKWDLRVGAEPLGQTVLHLAANMDDEGRMAGLLLRHPSCPEAGMLWSVLKNAAGQTAADIAFSASKARPGRIFLLLSPAERAAIGPYHSCTDQGDDEATDDGDNELTPESSSEFADSPSLSAQASGSLCLVGDEAFARKGSLPLSREGSLPVTPFLDVALPPQPLPEAVEPAQQMRTVESAPLETGELSAARTFIATDDRIIRKSLSADTDAHAGREQLRAALLPALASVAAAQQALPEGLSPPRLSLDGGCIALRFAGDSGSPSSPSLEELRRLRRAIAAFPAAAAEAAAGGATEMQRLSVVMRDVGAVRSASAGVVQTAANDCPAGELPLCLSSPSVFPATDPPPDARPPSDKPGPSSTEREAPAPTMAADGPSGGVPDAPAALPGATWRIRGGCSVVRMGWQGRVAMGQLSARQVSLVLLLLASCLVLPRAAFMCMLASASIFLFFSCHSGQEVWANSSSSFRGLNASIDKLEAQATYCGWRRHLLVFKSADMERDFLQFFAGARYQLDVLFSVLFTVLSVLLLCSGGRLLSNPAAAAPWVAHAAFAALPAALALDKRSWYVRHREVVMMVARIGCQLAALFCSTSLASGCCAPNHWAAALLGDVLAAALQLLHLPIGFQIRTFLHLPLTLLALRLRMRMRPQPSWAQAAAVCALMLLPTSLVAALEHRARRCFLASLHQRSVCFGVPPRSGRPAGCH